MLRPAGPRISSMMPVTRSGGRYCCSSRSVPSNVPISAPEADIRDTNSSSRSSTTSASTVPSVDITIDSSRTSSSSSSDQTLPPYCSPSASIRIAARFGPLIGGPFGRLLWRLASVAMTLWMPLALVVWGTSMSGRRFRQPLTHDRSGLVRVALGEFADAMHGLGVNLALDLGDVDHRSRGGHEALAGLRTAVGQRRHRIGAGQRGDRLGRDDAADQRTD